MMCLVEFVLQLCLLCLDLPRQAQFMTVFAASLNSNNLLAGNLNNYASSSPRPTRIGRAATSEKYGRRQELSISRKAWHHAQLKSEAPAQVSPQLLEARKFIFDDLDEFGNDSVSLDLDPELDQLNSFTEVSARMRLVNDLLDPDYYEKSVHPRRDHTQPTRVNLSMSLYQILDVDERSQSLIVNVWMVQDWYDEFLDWNPEDYDNISKTIIPYREIWVPDTYLYNSEALEQKKTEALMNAIVSSSGMSNTVNYSSNGAAIQLMFPAIYKLTCKMNVRFFPYDQQNCSFIIGSWTNDFKTIDYWPKTDIVNLKNMAINEEWAVISFHFERVVQLYKCCEDPWVMLYAHLVIRRKPLYYILNLVIPTSIITVVAVTGFFTPSSTSSERDEKLYLGINTLLTMSIMMLMVVNQMPSTSTYVPLMGWYYLGIIMVIVIGTLLATVVLLIHGRKSHCKPLSKRIRSLIYNRAVTFLILEPPAQLIDIWTEYGLIDQQRLSTANMDPLLVEKLDPISHLPPHPAKFFTSISSQVSNCSDLSYERRLASITKQYAEQVKQRERDRRRMLPEFVQRRINTRDVKKQKLARRCALEWEFLCAVLDRLLLTLFSGVTAVFVFGLAFFDNIFDIY